MAFLMRFVSQSNPNINIGFFTWTPKFEPDTNGKAVLYVEASTDAPSVNDLIVDENGFLDYPATAPSATPSDFLYPFYVLTDKREGFSFEVTLDMLTTSVGNSMSTEMYSAILSTWTNHGRFLTELLGSNESMAPASSGDEIYILTDGAGNIVVNGLQLVSTSPTIAPPDTGATSVEALACLKGSSWAGSIENNYIYLDSVESGFSIPTAPALPVEESFNQIARFDLNTNALEPMLDINMNIGVPDVNVSYIVGASMAGDGNIVTQYAADGLNKTMIWSPANSTWTQSTIENYPNAHWMNAPIRCSAKIIVARTFENGSIQHGIVSEYDNGNWIDIGKPTECDNSTMNSQWLLWANYDTGGTNKYYRAVYHSDEVSQTIWATIEAWDANAYGTLWSVGGDDHWEVILSTAPQDWVEYQNSGHGAPLMGVYSTLIIHSWLYFMDDSGPLTGISVLNNNTPFSFPSSSMIKLNLVTGDIQSIGTFALANNNAYANRLVAGHEKLYVVGGFDTVTNVIGNTESIQTGGLIRYNFANGVWENFAGSGTMTGVDDIALAVQDIMCWNYDGHYDCYIITEAPSSVALATIDGISFADLGLKDSSAIGWGEYYAVLLKIADVEPPQADRPVA